MARLPPARTDIVAAKKRLATAEAERITWRLSKMQEKYLESCSMYRICVVHRRYKHERMPQGSLSGLTNSELALRGVVCKGVKGI